MSGPPSTGRTAALIPAAGAGTRLGRGPKAFVTVAGRSLLARSVAALAPLVDEVVVALPPGLSAGPGAPPGVRVIPGGDTRQASVHRLLRATAADTVLVHDAARPFVPRRVVLDLLQAAACAGAATAALPVADTLVRADAAQDRGAEQTQTWGHFVPRDGLWAVQTPQAFRRDVLLAAHDAAHAAGFQATDDAGLIVYHGGRVRLVPGDARLFKVTTPGDLALAQALAQVWDHAEAGAEGPA